MHTLMSEVAWVAYGQIYVESSAYMKDMANVSLGSGAS